MRFFSYAHAVILCLIGFGGWMTMSVMGTLVVTFVAATPLSMDRDDTSNDVSELTRR